MQLNTNASPQQFTENVLVLLISSNPIQECLVQPGFVAGRWSQAFGSSAVSQSAGQVPSGPRQRADIVGGYLHQ